MLRMCECNLRHSCPNSEAASVMACRRFNLIEGDVRICATMLRMCDCPFANIIAMSLLHHTDVWCNAVVLCVQVEKLFLQVVARDQHDIIVLSRGLVQVQWMARL